MESRREIKLSSWNEYHCFETDNRRTRSHEVHFHMAFLVVEILNQRQLIKYEKISKKRPFLEGVPNLKKIKYFDLIFCQDHFTHQTQHVCGV